MAQTRRFTFRHEMSTNAIPFESAKKEAVKYIEMCRDKDGLEVRLVSEEIGKGVFAVKDYEEGEFLMEYHGELVSRKEGEERLEKFAPKFGSYIYFFVSSNGKRLCIDATFSKRYGRFANDAGPGDVKQNAIMRKIFIGKRPYLALFATRQISAGEEIRYDYNDNLCNLPWRIKKTTVSKLTTAEKILESVQEYYKLKKCSVVLTKLPALKLLGSKTNTSKATTAKICFSGFKFTALSFKDLYNVFPKENGYSFGHCYSSDVTHVVTASERDGEPRFTMKVMKGILDGKRIVSSHWIRDSLVHGKVLPEKDYMFNIAAVKNTDSGMKVKVIGSFGEASKDDVVTLLTKVGITLEEDNFNAILFDSSNKESFDIVQGLQREDSALKLLTWSWLLDSIQCGEMKNLESYTIDEYVGLSVKEVPNDKVCLNIQKALQMGVYKGLSIQEVSNGEDKFVGQSPQEVSNGEDEFVGQSPQEVPNGEDEFVGLSTQEVSNGEPDEFVGQSPQEVSNGEDEFVGLSTQEVSNGEPDEFVGLSTQEVSNGEDEFVGLPSQEISNNREDEFVGLSVKEVSNTEEAVDENPVTSAKSGNKTLGKKYVRRENPCPFCGFVTKRLTDHLKSKHKEEESVKNAMSLPKELKDRAFAQLKSDGIAKSNFDKMKRGKVDISEILRERNQGGPCAVKWCSMCRKVLKASTFYKHKAKCRAAEGSTTTPTPLSLRMLTPDEIYPDSYRKNILESFHDKEYGNVIRSDDWIKTFGYYLFQNMEGSSKKQEKRISVTSKLRRLAHLFLKFKEILLEKEKILVTCCSEMFDRKFMVHLQSAITKMTFDEERQKLKNGLKRSLRYLINEVCETMQANYLIKKEDDKAEELGKFMTILKSIFPSFFKSAEESMLTKRQEELRAPVKLPSRADIIKLRNHTMETIEEMTGDGFSLYDFNQFCKLRDALVCRLTLFNARRGGEPSRMSLSEFDDAINNKWVDPRKVEAVSDEIEKKLLCESKVAYIQASKLAKLVPVNLPKDCWKGLKVLADEEVRRCAGINPENSHVFPNTKYSLNHVSGWMCVANMCNGANLEQNINATGMRHYIATEYALLDVEPKDREIFYKHMGHSQTTNENIYQCPPAVRQITHVGKILNQLDNAADSSKWKQPKVTHVELDVIKEFPNLQQSEVADAELDVIEEFLGEVAKDVQIYELLDFNRLVQEDDVTIDPEQLQHCKDLVLNKRVQECAKQFFSDDAWLALQNTLKMLQGLKRNIKDEDAFGDKDSGVSRRKIRRENQSEYSGDDIQVADSEDEFIHEQHQDSSSECDNSDGSDTAEKDKPKKARTFRKRHSWTSNEDAAIGEFFRDDIEDVKTTGNKGKLQVTKKIYEFIKKYPEVLNEFSLKEKVKKIRIKIVNMRRKTRQQFEENMRMLQ